jgi:hypothetical protein
MERVAPEERDDDAEPETDAKANSVGDSCRVLVREKETEALNDCDSTVCGW